jgi:hypothetical protein
MNTTAAAIAAALTFTWLGMVLAISFLEAPLKFRAPGVTIPIGLGIGRLVFRALNSVEAVLAVVIAIAVFAGHPTLTSVVLAVVAVVVLAVQLTAVRPVLTRRSNLVLEAAGADLPRSRAHWWYVATESAKVIALIVLGVSVLAR